MRTFIISVMALCGFFSTFSALGAWLIDVNHSAIHFTSIKKDTVAEVHQFKTYSGQIDNSRFAVEIDLASVDTAIEIRDQRMRDFLFHTTQFSKATFSGQLPKNTLASLLVDSSMHMSIVGELTLHGKTKAINADVIVSKLSSNRIVVSTVKPVIVNAVDFGLTEGIVKLQQLAGLPSISQTVPVTFSLSLKQE